MKKPCLFWVLVVATFPLFAETVLSGDFFINNGTYFDSPFHESVNTTGLTFYPTLEFYGDTIEFSATGSIDTRTEEALRWGLVELYFTWYFSDYATMTAGRISESISASRFFTPFSFNTSSNPMQIMESPHGFQASGRDQLSLSFFWQDWFARLSVMPFTYVPALADIGSVWFPEEALPQELQSPFSEDTYIHIEEIYYTETVIPETDLTQFSYLGLVGGNLFSVDISLLFFYGFPQHPLIVPSVFLKDGWGADYDIQLSPEYDLQYGPGFALDWAWEGLRLYGEGYWNLHKPVLVSEIESSGKQIKSGIGIANVIELTAGALYDLYFPQASLHFSSEFRTSIFINTPNKYTTGMFTTLWVNSATARLFEGRLQMSIGLVNDFNEDADRNGGALLSDIVFAPEYNMSFYLTYPFIFGGVEDYGFGMYTDVYELTLGMRMSF
ncbi:MAG: hypothetical protein ACLFR1_14655 [Spirochaetia bacterium]